MCRLRFLILGLVDGSACCNNVELEGVVVFSSMSGDRVDRMRLDMRRIPMVM